MSRLLNANFARLFESRVFKICAVISAVYGIGKVIWNIIFPAYGFVLVNNRDLHLFDMAGIDIFIITAIFICLFIGQEYDGAMRNKIIVGAARVSIYLANLVTCLAGAGMLYIIFSGSLLITFALSGGKFVLPVSTVALHILLQLFSVLSISAVFTVFSMVIHQKSASAILSLVMLFFLVLAESFCYSRLNIIENTNFVYDEITDSVIEREYNEDELGEMAALRFALNINPAGQQSRLHTSYCNELYRVIDPQFVTDNDPAPVQIIPYSLGIIAVSTAVGVIIFRRLNLK